MLPLVVLLMLRLLERPSIGRGVALGIAFAALTFAASYFGAMMGVVLVIVAGGWLLTLRRGERKPTLAALGVTLGVLAVVVAPVGLQYLKLQQHKEFRRGFETSSGELLVKDEPAEPMEEGEIEREHLTRAVPKVEKK